MYTIDMKENKVILKVNKEFNGFDLMDYFLSYHINKSVINNLINNKKIKINNEIIKHNKYNLTCNDEIEILFEVEDIKPYKKEVFVIYEDEHIIVVNKQANILVHEDGNTTDTLTNAVSYYLTQNKKCGYAYPIHRLDYETTGIVIFAKNRLALSFLSVSIENYEVKKEYVCLCDGLFSKLEGIINNPIGKDRHSNKQIVTKSGKSAETKYKVINNGKVSKVSVLIKQGRKHQIRVHMASINHPVVGDKIYGNNSVDGLKLHFRKIEFVHPYTRETMTIECKENF